MSLNPSTFASLAAAPSSKLTLNISAFNGNTTNFNLGRPRPKLFVTPTQPRTVPWNPAAAAAAAQPLAGHIRPM